MVKSFANKGTEDIFYGDDTKDARATLPKNLWNVAARKLDALKHARQASDMKIPAGNRLEKLKGNRAGQFSVRINDQFRICFGFEGEDAVDVEIVDYH